MQLFTYINGVYITFWLSNKSILHDIIVCKNSPNDFVCNNLYLSFELEFSFLWQVKGSNGVIRG